MNRGKRQVLGGAITRAFGSLPFLLDVRRLARRRLALLLVRQLPMDIGPEFFHHDRNRVVSQLCSPHADGILHSFVRAGMVTVGRNEGRHTAPNNF